MTLVQLAVFTAAAAALGAIPWPRWRSWGLYGTSLVMLFWLQPATPLRHADFWLPAVLLLLTILGWLSTQTDSPLKKRENLTSLVVIAVLFLMMVAARVTNLGVYLTATRPPGFTPVIVALAGSLLLLTLIYFVRSGRGTNAVLSVFILLLFIVLKTDVLTTMAAHVARRWVGQDPQLAAPVDLNWLGFSYIAFRLLHTLRDQRAGRLPAMTLREYATYVLFFPAIVAGPIDRAERFLGDLRSHNTMDPERVFSGGKRLILGIFKKYVLAAMLAVFALRVDLLTRVESGVWLWVLVYAYAFQLYLDFSGYTDVAVGLGLLAGIELPENFNHPYRKVNLTTFWNSWHMTLAQWFRAYFFNPITRALRRRRTVPTWLIILIGQAGTMILIGLWHGVTWNFFLWGAWHAAGLFVHNRWVDFTRSHSERFERVPARVHQVLGVLLTFHFVSMGWLWFALPTPSLAWETLLRMLGL